MFLPSFLLYMCCWCLIHEDYTGQVLGLNLQYVASQRKHYSSQQSTGSRLVRLHDQRLALSSEAIHDHDASSNLMKGTIQILMSDTGGGHRASANALRDAFNVLYPNQIECDIVDIYTDYGPFWPFNDYVNMYKLMAQNPWMWDLFYHMGATPIGLIVNEFLLNLFCFEPFTQCIQRRQPSTNDRADMIISVHPLTQDLPLNILGYLDSNGTSRSYTSRSKTPFVTVVTDLGSAHPTWFHRGVDQCYVPSQALYQKALDRGITVSQLKQYGLPIRKGFWSEYSSDSDITNNVDRTYDSKAASYQKETLRKELQLQNDLPTVLIVGGGDGMGGIVNLAKELGDRLGSSNMGLSYQVVVICGKNEIAKASLAEYQFPDNVTVHVKGFVNNMDQYMRASDVLVTKAGPGTIAEASICGLPCMMFSYLYVQLLG
jgi:1,2-diacylglycerol 3-beta-galactosyltransferase